MSEVCPVIVGVGRSGTTLLRLMLDAHPELAIPPETHFITRLAGLAEAADVRTEFLAIVMGSDRWLDFGISEQELRAALDNSEDFGVSGCLRCFYRAYAARFGKPRWGEKTPSYVRWMKSIQRLLPEAGFIHVIRDGRDVALSSRGLWFGPGRDMEKQARWWVELINGARFQAPALSRYMEVHYEALLAAPERELRRVCAFLDLEYRAEMLDYTATAAERISALQDVRDVQGAIVAPAQVRQMIHATALTPPDRTRALRWRSEMTEDEQRVYESIAGPVLRELGYETRF